MASRQLPQELFCRILSFLAQVEDNSAGSLRACALTCRALAPLAQAQLFRTLTLHWDARVVPWLQKLENAPHLARFIKHVDFREIHRPWIRHNEALPKLLDLLALYTISLEIRQRRNNPARPRFNYPSLSQLQHLEEIFLSEEADDSDTSCDNALPKFLNHFPKLRTTTFERCTVQNEAVGCENGVQAVHAVFQLKKVDLFWCDDAVVLEWLVPALSSLQTLCIPRISPVILKYITTAGQSLQCLEVRKLSSTSDEDMQLLSAIVTHATDLRSLKLTAAGCALVSRCSPIQVVVQALLLIGAHALAQLRELTIIIPTRDAFEDGNSWNELQNLLLGAHFPALRSVECHFVWRDGLIKPLTRPEAILGVVPRLAQKRMPCISTSKSFA